MSQQYSNTTGGINESQINTAIVENAEAIFIWIISIFEFPTVLLTLIAMCFLIKSHRSASVYVTHLILSDLLQIGFILILTTELATGTLWTVYKYCLTVGLFLMACIAIERYVLVSFPHWYKTHHSIKISFFLSVIVWLLPLSFLNFDGIVSFTLLSEFLACFIPYLIILMCFIGTWRGLSLAISLTPQKRKLILGSLSLVLLNYTFLILPLSITNFILIYVENPSPFAMKIYVFCHCLLYLNPFADCLLYLFMRSDADTILKSLYCCRGQLYSTHSLAVSQSRSVHPPK